MGMNMPQSGSGKNSTPTALAEINVTPLVDVMLVLLIVFMISAPMMQQGIQVDLPKANAPALSEPTEQIILSIDKRGKVHIGEREIEKSALKTKLQAIAAAKPGVEVFLQADRGVSYGTVAEVMAEVKQSKITRVGLVTQPTDGN
jgi:biopolymer transport protein TolR